MTILRGSLGVLVENSRERNAEKLPALLHRTTIMASECCGPLVSQLVPPTSQSCCCQCKRVTEARGADGPGKRASRQRGGTGYTD